MISGVKSESTSHGSSQSKESKEPQKPRSFLYGTHRTANGSFTERPRISSASSANLSLDSVSVEASSSDQCNQEDEAESMFLKQLSLSNLGSGARAFFSVGNLEEISHLSDDHDNQNTEDSVRKGNVDEEKNIDFPIKAGHSSFLFSMRNQDCPKNTIFDIETSSFFSTAFNNWIIKDNKEMTEELLTFYEKIVTQGVGAPLSEKESSLLKEIMKNNIERNKTIKTENDFQSRAKKSSKMTGLMLFSMALNARLRSENRESSEEESRIYLKIESRTSVLNEEEIKTYQDILMGYVREEAQKRAQVNKEE